MNLNQTILSAMLFNVIVFVSLYIGKSHSQGLSAGETCLLKSSGGQGVCKLFSSCKVALDGIKEPDISPQTCGFQKNEPLVCCEVEKQLEKVDRIPGEVSKQRCEEYAKYTIREARPILLPLAIGIKYVVCHQSKGLIVGGNRASKKEFPHMAAVGFEDNETIQWLCEGSLISPQFILTNSHCLKSNLYGHPKYVKLGSTQLNNSSTSEQKIKIVDWIFHPEYTPLSYYHDIGLLKLERAADMNLNVRPACLFTEQIKDFEQVIATGWDYENQLLKLHLNVESREQCNTSHALSLQNKIKNGVDDGQFCTKSKLPGYLCLVNSGGPLQMIHTGDKIKCMYDIVGVALFGVNCQEKPTLYTKVSKYIKWIEDIVWPLNI